MPRFRKGEYRTEKRAKPGETQAKYGACQGGMGLCREKKGLSTCPKCQKPYCGAHYIDHPKYCLGMLA